MRALVVIWEAAGYPWSVRLKALLPLWVGWGRQRLGLSAKMETNLLSISARQMDRLLGSHRHRLQRRQYGRTKPGTLLKHQIALKTGRWEVSEPGFTEIDLVAHSGERGDGEYVHTLNVTDIHTTWVESAAVMGKSQLRVLEALEGLRRRLPFPLRGIDSDNGSEFINGHLQGFCKAQKIEFTRGRPYKKDDNAHIEQKNWTHVRKLLGYVRYDSEAAVEAINAVYREVRLLQNLFLPSVKLIGKERIGARVRRRYDPPCTPLQRVQPCPKADRLKLKELVQLQQELDPFELARRVDRGLERVYRLANFQRGSFVVGANRLTKMRSSDSPKNLNSPVTGVLARRCASR